jgi:hypothetical protein
LVRIVETKDPVLLRQIIEATNSQTRVTPRDLHSNDEVQKLIEQHLASNGYFYEARKNKYMGKDTGKRIDAELAAQAFYAVFRKQPALAKDKKKLLFGEIYEDLFNVDTDPNDILYSFRLLKAVQKLNNQPKYSCEHTFLKDAALHIAALMNSASLESRARPVNVDKQEELEALYKRVISALSELVKERAKREKDKYEHRRTFKDIETFGSAQEFLAEMG